MPSRSKACETSPRPRAATIKRRSRLLPRFARSDKIATFPASMTPTENLTSAFESLWETKVYLLRTLKEVQGDLSPKLNAVLTEVSAARDRIEKLLIELQEKPPAAPP